MSETQTQTDARLAATRAAEAAEATARAAELLTAAAKSAAKVHTLAARGAVVGVTGLLEAHDAATHVRTDAIAARELAEELVRSAAGLTRYAPGAAEFTRGRENVQSIAHMAGLLNAATSTAVEELGEAVREEGPAPIRHLTDHEARELAATLIHREGTGVVELDDWRELAADVAADEDMITADDTLTDADYTEVARLINATTVTLPDA